MRGLLISAFAQLLILRCVLSNENDVTSVKIRLMPLGDGLTAGNKDAPGAYRRKLYKRLTNIGYDLDMVGSEISGDFEDVDHEGHKAFDIATMTEHVNEFLDSYEPDIIVLLIGSRDISNNFELEDMMDRWERLVEKISSIQPYSHIFAANLPLRKNEEQNQLIEKYFNSKVENSISNMVDKGKLISFVDMGLVIDPSSMLDTNVQPNADGYLRMGFEFADSIAADIDPRMSQLERGIIRVESTPDQSHVILVFSKPIPEKKVAISNFRIDGLNILEITLDTERRVVTLSTSIQQAATSYAVEVLSGVSGQSIKTFTTGWRFLALADWHLGEKYIFRRNEDLIQNDEKILEHLKETYGGELILIPGDTNAGFWDKESFVDKLSEYLDRDLSPADAVLEAGNLCYSGLLSTFRSAGYSKVLVAIGDHELGDNSWEKDSNKSTLQPQFREAFTSNFNFDYDGNPKYTESIGSVSSRPIGTVYENSSYAYIHLNTLIVTVDVLFQESPSVEIGAYGTVTGQVNSEHLTWFKSVLEEGNGLSAVKHIVVQGHLPVLYPVRKTSSSGMYMDNHEKSGFWQAMRDNGVDIYFCGEAHLVSVLKDTESDLIQIVGRGNFFSNFLTVDITDNSIDVTCYDEAGAEKNMFNYSYQTSGHLQLSKSGGVKTLESSGDLEILDQEGPAMYFTFEEVVSLQERPVLGLGELPGVGRYPVVEEVTVDGIVCHDSLINMGAFGQDYDAQTANVDLVEGVYGFGGRFAESSRAAVFSMGPHSRGNPISYTLWFKTLSFGARSLLAYEGFWNQDNVMNLRVRNGLPELVFSSSQKLKSSESFNDGHWHHIAVTMPSPGCLLSTVKVWVDGEELETVLIGSDTNVELPNGGMVSLGGFGYGNVGKESAIERTGFRDGLPFEGNLDEVLIWSRSLSAEEIRKLAIVPTSFALRTKLSYEWQEASCLGFGMFLENVVLRSCNDEIGQQWVTDGLGYIHNKERYDLCLIPELGELKVRNCVKKLSKSFIWEVQPNGLIRNQETNLNIAVDTIEANAIKMLASGVETDKLWDVVYEGDFAPSYLTGEPTAAPTAIPSSSPSSSPSSLPTSRPSMSPSMSPSSSPSSLPSRSPSAIPSMSPSALPSSVPTRSPSAIPTATPTEMPTSTPSSEPSTTAPTGKPTISVEPSSYSCEDNDGKFTLPNGLQKSCKQVQNNPSVCRFSILQQNCRKACNLCRTSKPSTGPTPSPSSPPTPLPSSSPIQLPSSMPSISEIPTAKIPACENKRGKFTLPNGASKSCYQASKDGGRLCQFSVIETNCRKACGICSELTLAPTQKASLAPSMPESVPGTQAPFPAPSIPQTEPPTLAPFLCLDRPGKIEMDGGKLKSCSNVENNLNLCMKKRLRDHCPVLCGLCEKTEPVECKDKSGKTEMPGGAKKSCDNVKNNGGLCARKNIREHCPDACGLCEVGEQGASPGASTATSDATSIQFSFTAISTIVIAIVWMEM